MQGFGLSVFIFFTPPTPNHEFKQCDLLECFIYCIKLHTFIKALSTNLFTVGDLLELPVQC